MPSLPGVYWFLDGNGSVLYVGKAKNLKNRLRQYANLEDERPQIASLLATSSEVKWQVRESELEALLVEAELIRRYQPHYNILLKDDKSSLYLCIGTGPFPRIFMARKPEILRASEKWTTFGPFQSGYKVKQVLEITRHVFKWCEHPQTGRPCFYYHLKLCNGACIGTVSSEQYAEMIHDLKQFMRGKTSELVKEFKNEIVTLSESQSYEDAALVRDQLDALTVVTSPKYRLRPDMTIPMLTNKMEEEALISLRSILRQYLPLPANAQLSRIEGYDISNIQGTNASCSMVTAIDGMMDHSEYKHFGIKTLSTPNDYAMLKEALARRQNHPEWGTPDVVLIDGGKGQLRGVLSIWNWRSVVVSIAKKPDRLFIPLKTIEKRKEKLIFKEVLLTPDLPATRLLQSIRDESHRFAKRLHIIKRNKAILK